VLIPVHWFYQEIEQNGKAYVSKVDGGYFLYIATENGQLIKKLKKSEFDELSYIV
jgi:hypothetical protein